ncbi:hypothetical protein GCM10009665_29530 [Kitasatospora nipponensis]|uniref:Thiopeptide-type bacteriocin biosynthesis domain-containing protein n=1 Tax=Kitasatospora nipponensis TaxID=258049 RepID=A0ABN1WAA8_9ACTN
MTEPTGPWRQVNLHFANWPDVEQLAARHLLPALTAAQGAGDLTGWHFLRKAPCWRMRYRPRESAAPIRDELDPILRTLHAAGHLSRTVEVVYEPETHAFGGPAAMDIAHRLFHQDSHAIIDFLSHPRGPRDHRREVSILLLVALMRGARQDWYEQGDIWARTAANRPLDSADPDRLASLRTSLTPLLAADTGPASRLLTAGPLAFAAPWLAAFQHAGQQLHQLHDDGRLARGLRAVLAHHVLFHWNRIGIPHRGQALIARAAQDTVLAES